MKASLKENSEYFRIMRERVFLPSVKRIITWWRTHLVIAFAFSITLGQNQTRKKAFHLSVFHLLDCKVLLEKDQNPFEKEKRSH